MYLLDFGASPCLNSFISHGPWDLSLCPDVHSIAELSFKGDTTYIKDGVLGNSIFVYFLSYSQCIFAETLIYTYDLTCVCFSETKRGNLFSLQLQRHVFVVVTGRCRRGVFFETRATRRQSLHLPSGVAINSVCRGE